jgi:hypothetical protein
MLIGFSEAAVPRAFVSVSGSDANPCSAVQPCRSFNQALVVVEPGGEIVVRDSGGYSTGFTITKSVTIDAAGFNASVITTSVSDACLIEAGISDRFILRGISFHGASIGGNAISAVTAGILYVEHCSIADFNGSGVIMGSGGDLLITDTDVRGCKVSGVGVEANPGSVKLVAQDSRFTECGDGVALAPIIAGATAWLTNCTVSLCSKNGFACVSTGSVSASLTLANCCAVAGGTGIGASALGTGNAFITINNCVVTGNTTGIALSQPGGGTAAVFGTVPGTNLIAFNGSGNTTGNILPPTLQ